MTKSRAWWCSSSRSELPRPSSVRLSSNAFVQRSQKDSPRSGRPISRTLRKAPRSSGFASRAVSPGPAHKRGGVESLPRSSG